LAHVPANPAAFRISARTLEATTSYFSIIESQQTTRQIHKDRQFDRDLEIETVIVFYF